jgi:hypothetical protein
MIFQTGDPKRAAGEVWPSIIPVCVSAVRSRSPRQTPGSELKRMSCGSVMVRLDKPLMSMCQRDLRAQSSAAAPSRSVCCVATVTGGLLTRRELRSSQHLLVTDLCAMPQPNSHELSDTPSGPLMPDLDRGGLVGPVATAAGESAASCR